jgi:hypothetical protein
LWKRSASITKPLTTLLLNSITVGFLITPDPRPHRCVHDNDGEFIGEEFQSLLQQMGVKDVPTTSRNPQVNTDKGRREDVVNRK